MSEDFLARIEDAALNASAPPQQLWLDGWFLRLCPGKAKRARSVNAVAAGRLPLADKLARAASAYREAQLPMVVRITPFTRPTELDTVLADRGWLRFDDTRVMVAADLRGLDARPLPAACQLVPADAATYAEVVGRLRGSSAAQRQGHAQRLALSPVPYQGWLLQRDDQLLACAQFAREGELVGLYDVFTAASARGQGLAQALCGELLLRAVAQGARIGYLQVEAHNAPAQAVYRKLGFVDGYRYHYRAEDPAAAL